MPGQKRKYNVRFPPGRIKKIMQKDTEVGRIASAVPIIISKALEMFLRSFLTMTCKITQSRNSRVMSINHMKRWQSVSIKARSPEREEPPQKATNELAINSDSSTVSYCD
uniref:Transcription factor CBF/NF-Y/archaeal histone domain-containing protein n=1 Tax=Cyprinus carpio carpio TaxID=630221 RepID=A0A9J8AVY2_CYPCA